MNLTCFQTFYIHLKVGARVIVRCNINIERVWGNGTIAQVVSLAQNCIVLCQVDKPKVRLALPNFRQLITISGASYHIVRRQFLIMPGYAVIVIDAFTHIQNCNTSLQLLASSTYVCQLHKSVI